MSEDRQAQIINFQDDDELRSWLESKASSVSAQTSYLLAHAEDGIIWGRFDSKKLTTAEKIFHKRDQVDLPELRLLTLQQCRIFGRDGEILLWRISETKFKWRFIGNPEEDKIPESQILWGTHGEKQRNFTLLWDGSQGLKHAVPFTDIELEGDRLVKPVRLLVHHYIKYEEETGLARIYRSRLVDLTTKQEIKS
ncbi:TIGR03984 family CRISPR-associated protein [Tychonema sp. LEGE 07199]|uniref:type III-D CRISPR-associated protein Csx19 n=1 Tax=unclassified Tychonema TaxID=2642144 RepID=UPI001880E2D4|nr:MULTISPECIES: CRISPR-associated protein Csx19 [unclassified Tychonema]MBE9120862.1 TIGR03984 family CRISPR-associated protein [Tychonema sp. LEGE 07199]MBE9134011.1 TIGR03984 family CRISPR-associated protein [Tychonema sp. LEGE 07196]